jgi:hypothetical protein
MRLLGQEGRRALLDGNRERALANAVALRRIAEQLSEDPRGIAQALSGAAEHAADNVIEHFVYLHTPTAAEIAQLVRPGFEFHSHLPRHYTWEQAEHYHMLAQRYFGLVPDNDMPKLPGIGILHAAILARDRLLNAGDDVRALPQIFEEQKRRAAIPYGQPLTGNKQPMWLFEYRCGGGAITNSIHPVGWVPLRADMQRRLVDFALSIAQRGLVDEILRDGPEKVIPSQDRPLDLMDGKPIRVVVADQGVVVYSVDIDGEDDGGSEGYLRDKTFCLGEACKIRRLTPKKKDSDEAPVAEPEAGMP